MTATTLRARTHRHHRAAATPGLAAAHSASTSSPILGPPKDVSRQRRYRRGVPSRVTRRAALTATASGLAALAGCSALGGSGDGGDDRMEFALDTLLATNKDSVSHTLHLQVSYDGDPIFWQSYDLGTEGNDSDPPADLLADHDWPEEPGTYAVRARVDDAETWETFTEVNSRDCAVLFLHIVEGGGVAALSKADSSCDEGEG
ncbi:hypothetical protein [Halobacterium jilantaiense]|uniref:hypothetical protein n=1 Tax=Halobacterium jilantaiense TaxID=355548 RepID=UPI0011600A6A|nr:hypothetical protein [Halobacterium jilantaiense]